MYESGKGSYWQHPSAISFWEQVLSLFLSHSPNHVIPHREQEIKSSVFWELLENWFWEHSKPLQICRKTKDVKTVAFPLCSSSDLRKHMQLYHREQTLDLGGGEAIIPQGKHRDVCAMEGRTFPSLSERRLPRLCSSSSLFCFALTTLDWVDTSKGLLHSFQKNLYIRFQRWTDAAAC